ncbi:MAG: selenocysteine-specific translation elongation factor [Candidatus Sericytochromatia bacterium]|nr:selenocysteine-specific translation elongation factor [Candidatus Sericytochromatia bacterium]
MTLPFVLGFAGHVDHGKTSLIQALTGVNTDRLLEEQRRGMTIDLGFAACDLPGGGTISIIDVPGHERFLKNMLAGVGGIDAALLVVAADDGVMPQTREHLSILSLLGIREGIVALSKTDLVDADLVELASLDVREALKRSKLPDWSILPVSSATGAGIDRLRCALAELVATHSRPSSTGAMRLPIDRVFSKQGFGTVVTGTLRGGGVAEGDTLTLLPEGKTVRVRGVQVHSSKTSRALPGNRVAVNLSAIEHSELRRGDWLTASGVFEASRRLDIQLSLLAEANPVTHRTRIRLYHGSGEYIGRLRLLDKEEVLPGDNAFAQLILETPVVACFGDRLLLRRYSPTELLGGGMVLHATPGRSRRHHEPTRQVFSLLSEGDIHRAVREVLRQSGERPVREDLLLAYFPPELREPAREWLRAEAFMVDNHTFLHPDGAEQVASSIKGALAAFHLALPWRRGLSAEELAKRTRQPLQKMAPILKALGSRGQVRATGKLLHLVEHHPVLTKELKSCHAEIIALFDRQPLAERADFEFLGNTVEWPALIEDMLEAGDLLRVGAQIYTTPQVLAAIHTRLRMAFEAHPLLTASQMRETIGTSRKYAIPFLEYLDTCGFTRRSGDQRALLAREPQEVNA